MTHADFHRAILDEPDDDLVRLAFADWLEEQGEVDRAAFLRLGVAYDRARQAPAKSAQFEQVGPLRAATDAAFAACWPAAYTTPAAVSLTHRRGLVVLAGNVVHWVNRKAASWLPAAHAVGWVGAVRVGQLASVSRLSLARAWAGTAAGLPLEADGAGGDLDGFLTNSFLNTLAVNVDRIAPNGGSWLRRCTRLRCVSLYDRPMSSQLAAALSYLAEVPRLRRLELHARLGDGDPAPAFPALGRLVLYRNALTDPGVARFQAANPATVIELPT